jgi:hypothetical protein
MTSTYVAVAALVVVIIAVIWGKDVRAAFDFLGLGSFSLEATDPKSRLPRQRNTQKRRLPE